MVSVSTRLKSGWKHPWRISLTGFQLWFNWNFNYCTDHIKWICGCQQNLSDINMHTVLTWWQWGTRLGPWLAGITFLLVVALNIGWDCLSRSALLAHVTGEIPPFSRGHWQSPSTAMAVGKYLPLVVCKGTVEESMVTIANNFLIANLFHKALMSAYTKSCIMTHSSSVKNTCAHFCTCCNSSCVVPWAKL